MTAPQDPFSTPPQAQPGAQPTGFGAPVPPPAYGAPVFGSPAGRHGNPRNGLGVAALVLGVLSLLSGLFLLGGALGVVAIVLGALGRGRAKRGEATNGGMALAGIVLGTLGLLLTIAVIAGAATFLNSDTGRDLQSCLEQAGSDQTAIDACSAELEDRVRR